MNRSWLQSVLMYLWLTIGFAVIHHVIALWGIALLAFIAPNNQSYDMIQITKDGEVVVQTYANRNRDMAFRQVDGTPIANTLGIQKSFADVTHLADIEPGEPASWSRRIESFHDFQKPATSWYFIAEPGRNHTAYFVGYEPLSRRLIGYLGTKGFSPSRPSISESFPVQQSQHGAFYGRLIASQKLYNYATAYEPNGEYFEREYIPLDNARPDDVWVLSNGTLYEIHLGDRSIKTVFTNRPEIKNVFRLTDKHGDTTSLQLVCRSENELLTVDPKSSEITSLPLASVPAGTSESMYQLANNRKVFAYAPIQGTLDHPENHRIIWVDSDGRIERELETKLHGYRSVDTGLQTFAGVICPAPIVSLGSWFVAPFFMAKELLETQTYFERFSSFAQTFASWLVVSAAAGLLSGWACRRRELDVFGNQGWFWPILVGISGWFGWVGYACVRPLPARLANGIWMPKHPESTPLIGTEIFA